MDETNDFIEFLEDVERNNEKDDAKSDKSRSKERRSKTSERSRRSNRSNRSGIVSTKKKIVVSSSGNQTSSRKDEENEVHISEFDIRSFPTSCTVFMVGPPASGKSTLMQNIIYYNRDKYPCGRVWTGNSKGYVEWCQIFHPFYCSMKFDDESLGKISKRAAICEMEMDALKDRDRSKYEKYRSAKNMLYVIDDFMNAKTDKDTNLMSSKVFQDMFTTGSQHYDAMGLFGAQVISRQVPDTIRNSMSYAVIFNEQSVNMREKLFGIFGGPCGTKENFLSLMQKITGNFRCMIIKKRSSSAKLEDCVFYYDVSPVTKHWKFGCDEHINWAKDRYDSDYREEL